MGGPESTSGPDDGTGALGPGRRRTVALLSVVTVCIVAALAWAFLAGPWSSSGGGQGGGGTAGVTGPSPSVSPSDAEAAGADPGDPAAAAPQAGPAAPDQETQEQAPISPELEPVAPDAVATGDDGVEAVLQEVEQVDGQAVAPGEISGPAVRLTVELTNASPEVLDLGYVVVNAYVGPDRLPAGTLMQPGGRPFGGELAPGESATGVSIFTIPQGDRDDVTVTVDYRPGHSTLAFRGSLQ